MSATRTLRRRPVAAAVVAATLTAAARADGPVASAPASTRPASAAALFPLASVPPARLPTPAELDRRWTAFQHADPATAGFNAVSLPIHYVDPDHLGDPAEADAFAFLLSGDLDWSPGCYCQRHAYFVFKTDPARVAATVADGDAYHPDAVARLVDGWAATAAIGGTITRSAAGYTGVLTICDPSGRVTHRQAFATPQAFFGLLGDFSADALAYFGPRPSAKLVRFLHARRCKDESIRRLGAAAHLPRGPEDLDAFATLLDHDFEFAEARFWVANQAGWSGLSKSEQARQFAMAMDVRVAPECWRTLDADQLPHEFDSHYPAWRAELIALGGPDLPAMSERYLDLVRRRYASPEPAPLAVAMNTAARYPNDYWLLENLSSIIADGRAPGGPDVAAGMALAAVHSRFLTGTGSKVQAAEVFDEAAADVGRPGDGAAVLAAAVADGDDFTGRTAARLLSAFFAAGRYKSAVAVYSAMRSHRLVVAARSQVEAASAAAIVGRADVVDALLANYGATLAATQCLPLVRALADRLAGRPVDLDALWGIYRTLRAGTYPRTQYMLFLWQEELTGPGDRFHDEAERAAFTLPAFRAGRCVADLYDRRHPRPRAAEMYRGWRWLYPDDPMVRSALRAWAQRCPADAAAEVDVAQATVALRPFPPTAFAGKPDHSVSVREVNAALARVSVWSAAAALGALCDHGRFDDAVDLALRYQQFSGRDDVPQPEAWAQHLTREVERRWSESDAH